MTIFLLLQANAQTAGIDYMQITREEGLSGESVNEIAISDNGFAWIATSRDLYSYDTKRQKISNYNLSTLSPADIDLSYVAVRKSKVFLGSQKHGLFIYDLKKNTFRRVSGIGNVISNLSDTHDGKLCIAYSLLPSLSLFAEPGLAYYFKNGSGVKSAYTDKQLLFNVNVGVRFGK